MHRLRARQMLGVLLIGAFALPALAITLAHILGSSDGVRVDTARPGWSGDGVKILTLQEDGSFQNGDIVIAVDGVPLVDFVENLVRPWTWRSLGETGDVQVYTVLRDGVEIDIEAVRYEYPLMTLMGRAWDVVLMTFSLFAIGVVVFVKKPEDPATLPLLFMGIGAAFSTVGFFTVQVPDLLAGWPYLMDIWLQQFGYPLMLGALLHFCLVFPKRLPLVSRRPWLIPGAYLLPLAWAAGQVSIAARSKTVLGMLIALEHSWTVPTVVLFVASLLALIANWRRITDPVGRAKVRWVMFGFGVHVGLRLALWNMPELVIGHPLVVYDVLAPSTLFLPAAIGIAILRYNLFDIDLIISRSLIWSVLTVLVIGAYAGIVSLIGETLHASGTFGPSLLATGVIAILFQPMHGWVQGAVNRAIYGDRYDPYTVVSRLGERLEKTVEPGTVLPTIAETVAQALKVPYVAIFLGDGKNPSDRISYGTPIGDVTSLPLTFQSDRVGELQLSVRSRGESFSPADRRLIKDLLRQIGVAVHAVNLTEELKRSRERIVTAREEERRRLRRDLHDGVGPNLASIGLKLEAARNRLQADPETAEAILIELKGQTQQAIADVRRVAYDLRPPALDELGLASALREYTARMENENLRVDLSTSGALDHLPAAVEVAAYRIAVEGVANAQRHSGGSTCIVTLAADRDLLVRVSDNGHGMAPDAPVGVGLMSMRERASELGGSLDIGWTSAGLTVTAHLPLRSR